MNETVLIITDGNREIGYGHVARSLILAKEFKKNNFEVFFLQKKNSKFSDRISNQFFVYQINDYVYQYSEEIGSIIQENKIKLIVIDLIEIDYKKLEWLRHKYSEIKIVTITLFLFDLEQRYEHISFFPDLSVRMENKIRTNKYDEFYLYAGPSYLMFRDEFQNIEKTIQKKGRNILISMGGTDPHGITLKVIKALKEDRTLNLKVILSEISGCFKSVKKIAENSKNIELINKTDQISEIMVESDLAVINGGLTRYEVCLAKTPFVAVSIHNQQFNITKVLTDLGVGINLGVYNAINSYEIKKIVIDLLSNYPKRKEMSCKMNKLFDTKGAERIFKKIVGC